MSPGLAQEDRAPSPLMDYYKERLAAYLAKVRGPGPSPMQFEPRPRPTGDAILTVIREYDTPGQGYGLPDWENGSNWIEGAPSKTNRANHHAMDGTLEAAAQRLDVNWRTVKSNIREDLVDEYKT